MSCTTEYSYSFECLWTKKDSHWWWIILPLILFIICLFYIFSRPNYVRLTTRTYRTMNATNNASRCSLPKQHNDTFDQYRNESTPTSSKFLFEQQKNNRLSQFDETKYKTIQQLNNSHRCISSVNNNSSERFDQSNTTRLNGRIAFFLAYDFQLKYLYLNIIKARHLRARITNPPSTFVRVDIGPKHHETFSTKLVQNNSNPDYMTGTIFHIDLAEFSTNALKLTVYELTKDMSHVSLGTIYYPLEHLLIAQRAKGHVIWRDLLSGMDHSNGNLPFEPELGDSTTIGLIEIHAKISYDKDDECLNINVHSLHALSMIDQIYRVYVHASVIIHAQSITVNESPVTHGKCGLIVLFERSNQTVYNQLFQFRIRQDELHTVTVVLDVYHRPLENTSFEDILLSRTVILLPKISSLTHTIEEKSPKKKHYRLLDSQK